MSAGRALASVVDAPRRLLRGLVGRSRRSAVLAGVLAAVLLAASAVFAVLHVREQGAVAARAAATAAAEKSVPELLSYDHRTLAAEAEHKIGLLTGPFREDYAKLLREQVLPTAQQSGLVTTSTVVGAGSGQATADEVRLLLFVNQSTGSTGVEPAAEAGRLSVTMRLAGDRWLVAALKPV